MTGPLTGSFYLEYGFYRTVDLPSDASAEAVSRALAGVEALGDRFDVARSGSAPYSWTITFVSDIGDVSQLTVKSTDTNTPTPATTNTQGVACEVQTVATAGARDGTFTLSFGLSTTSAIAYDAEAAAVKAALEALTNVGDVHVTLTSPNTFAGGRTWTVTFLANGGALPMLVPDGSKLAAAEGVVDPAHVVVDRVHLGRSVDVGGQWSLAYGSYSTSFNAGASASQVQANLNGAKATTSLQDDVVVTRSEPDFTGGYAWQITFGQRDADVGKLIAGSSSLTGTQPTVVVEETRQGTADEIQVVTTGTTGSRIKAGSLFFLAFEGQETVNLEYNADATKVKRVCARARPRESSSC